MDGKVMEQQKANVTGLRCPLCGGTISSNSRFYGCDNFRSGCAYKIWREHFGVELSDKDITDLIETGKTENKITGFYSRKYGRYFSCHLYYSKERNRVEFERLGTASI